jgi:hypothetical protein
MAVAAAVNVSTSALLDMVPPGAVCVAESNICRERLSRISGSTHDIAPAITDRRTETRAETRPSLSGRVRRERLAIPALQDLLGCAAMPVSETLGARRDPEG